MISLKLYDKDGTTLLGLLPEPISFQIGLEFSEIGALSFEYPANGVNASLISVMKEISVTNELGAEYANARFVVTGITGDRTKADGKLTVNARSILWRLDTALTYPDGGIASGEVVRTFTGATSGEILKTLIDDAHARTALSGITYTFTNTLDSNSVAWPDTTDTEYQARASILSVMRSLADLGLVEVETSARVLKASAPDGLGVDRTTGANPVVLRTGYNITEAPEEQNADRLGSVALVEGDEMVIFERSNVPAVNSFGRLESSFTTSGIVDEEVMAAMSDAYLSTIALPARQLTVGLALGTGAPEPLKDFSVGDYVYTSTATGLERVRVRQITLSMSSGKFTASVTLGDRIYENEIRTARKLAAISSGSVNLGNGVPTTTPTTLAVPDTLAPSAPTGLSATSTGYLDNNLPRSSVALTWTAPITNTDSTALNDLIGYGIERRTSSNAPWEFAGSVSSNSATVSGLQPSIPHYFRVRAIDAFGNASAPTSSLTVNAATVTAAPASISAPTLSVKLGTITLKWDGLSAEGTAMAGDFHHADIHRSTTSGFTPSLSTKVGQFSGKDLAVYSDLTYGTAYYFKLIAYNTTGLASASSAQATATVTALVNTDLIAGTLTSANFAGGAVDTSALATGAVDASKILSGAVTTAKIAAGAIGANEIAANAIVAGKIAAGAVTAGTIDALAVTAGTIAANAITADKIEAGAITAVKISATAIDGMTITGAKLRTAATGQRIEIDSLSATNRIDFYGANGTLGALSVGTNRMYIYAPGSSYGAGSLLSMYGDSHSLANGVFITGGDSMALNFAMSSSTISLNQGTYALRVSPSGVAVDGAAPEANYMLRGTRITQFAPSSGSASGVTDGFVVLVREA